MKWVSEEFLVSLRDSSQDMPDYELLSWLVDECTELNPWLPIDENTPKDKEILVYDERFGPIRSMFIYGEWRSGDVTLRNIEPTHWMPLPKPPK